MRKTIDARQHEHVPCAGRQAGDRRLEVAACSGIGHGRIGQRVRDLFLGGRVDAQRLGPSPPLRKDGIHGDAVQPGAETAADLEARQAAPGLDEGFLRAVFGRLALGRHAQAQAVHPPDVPPVQAASNAAGEPAAAASTSLRSSAACLARSNSLSAASSANVHLGSSRLKPRSSAGIVHTPAGTGLRERLRS